MAGAAAQPFEVAGTALVVSGAALLAGWSFRETGGVAGATVILRDGSASGAVVASIGLSAGLSETQWLGDRGVGLYSGLHAQVASGAVQGAVWCVPAERLESGAETSEPEWWRLQDGVPL